MPRSERALCGYRLMWLFVLFDLPVDTKAQRREYARFHKRLDQHGFTMLQYSVYARHCASDATADAETQRIRTLLPPEGQVRVLGVTDRQFGRMSVFVGKKQEPVEVPPLQLSMF